MNQFNNDNNFNLFDDKNENNFVDINYNIIEELK